MDNQTLNKEHVTWVIDSLPRRVPADGAGQFFAVESHLLQGGHLEQLAHKFANILLKLNCYYDLKVNCGDVKVLNPPPEQLEQLVWQCVTAGDLPAFMHIAIALAPTTITLARGDSNMTLDHPTDDILQLVELLAHAEGLFVWPA